MHNIETVEIESAIVWAEFYESADHADISSEGSEMESWEALFRRFFINPALDIIGVLNSAQNSF